MNLDSLSKTETASKTVVSNSGEILTAGEKCRLRTQLLKCEKILRQSSEAWRAAARAFVEIRDLRLYRGEGYSDFGRYCKERLRMGKSTVNRQIGIAEVYLALASTGATKLPSSERQMRPLLALRQTQPGTAAYGENIVKVWDEAVRYAKKSRIDVTEKGVNRAMHHLGLDQKPKEPKREVDLEKRWQRLQAILEHEREFWPSARHNDLSERINALMRGWRRKLARVERSSPVVDLLNKATSFVTPETSPEDNAPVPTEAEAPVPIESEPPIPTDSIAPAPPPDDDFTIRWKKPQHPAEVSEDVEDLPNESKPGPEGLTVETVLKQVHGSLEDMASGLQETADNMPENLQSSERFDAMEQVAGELGELAEKLEEGIDSLVSGDSGSSKAIPCEMLMLPPCFVSGPPPKRMRQLIEIIRFVAEAIKAEAPDATANLRGVSQ